MTATIRTFIQSRAAGAMNAIADIQSWINPTPEIRLTDHVCWVLDYIAGSIFNLAYLGSAEELRDALDGLIPWRYMSERQRDAYLAEWGRVIIVDDYPEPADPLEQLALPCP